MFRRRITRLDNTKTDYTVSLFDNSSMRSC